MKLEELKESSIFCSFDPENDRLLLYVNIKKATEYLSKKGRLTRVDITVALAIQIGEQYNSKETFKYTLDTNRRITSVDKKYLYSLSEFTPEIISKLSEYKSNILNTIFL